MARWSNGIITFINLITLLIGLFLLSTRIFLATHDNMTCLSLLDTPCIRIGILGSCSRSSFLMWVYLLIYLILILAVTVGVILWTVVMAKGAVRLDVGKAHKLNDFTYWFQDQVMGIGDWSQARECLIRKNICTHKGRTDNFFFSNKLKIGCCHPPPFCGANVSTIHDCDAWKKETKIMCYHCGTCAAGFISQLAVLWQRLFPGIVILLVVLVFVFIIGCQAFRQNKADHYKRFYQTNKP